MGHAPKNAPPAKLPVQFTIVKKLHVRFFDGPSMIEHKPPSRAAPAARNLLGTRATIEDRQAALLNPRFRGITAGYRFREVPEIRMHNPGARGKRPTRVSQGNDMRR